LGSTTTDVGLGLSPFQRSIVLSYLFFVVAYTLSIAFALFVGGVGRLVPSDSVWFQIVGDLFAQSSDLGLRVFVCMIPLLTLLNLNFLWFRRLSTGRPLAVGHALLRTGLGVIIALPGLVLTVGMMITSAELTVGEWQLFLAYLPILFVVPLSYMLVISTLSADRKRQFLARGLLDARLWVPYVLFFLVLMIPAAGIVRTFFKGYWSFIPVGDILDRLLRALSVSVALPALAYIFARLSARTGSLTERDVNVGERAKLDVPVPRRA